MPTAAVTAGIGVAGLVQGHQDGKRADAANKTSAAIANRQVQLSEDQWDYYKEIYQPLETQLAEDAGISREESDRRVARVGADVDQQFDVADASNTRMMTRMGINPNSGAFDNRMTSNALAKAKAKSSATNATRIQSENDDFNQKMAVASMGQGIASNVNAGLSGASATMGSLAATHGSNASAATQMGLSLLKDSASNMPDFDFGFGSSTVEPTPTPQTG